MNRSFIRFRGNAPGHAFLGRGLLGGGGVGVAWLHWDLGVEYFGYVCGCLPLVFSELLSNVSMGKEKITSFRILILIFAINYF